jgi:hypothetical protein
MRKVEIGRHFEVGMRKWEAEGILEVGSRRSEVGMRKVEDDKVSGVGCQVFRRRRIEGMYSARRKPLCRTAYFINKD